MNLSCSDNAVTVRGLDSFNIKEILECGQCFRFERIKDDEYSITALGKYLTIKQTGDNATFSPCTAEEFNTLWHSYFDLDIDYAEIKAKLVRDDEIMARAVEFAGGIRLLNQDPFEALISFIISQNNNIPRIKGIISRLSDKYGVKCGVKYGEEQSAFPTLEALTALTEEDFKALGTGFRAKYLTDCVHKLAEGEIDLSSLFNTDIDKARKELIKIKGVGPKVADCVLLFSLKHRSAFPIDVWVKRVMSELYFEGEEQSIKTIADFADKKWGKLAGYAQQYLFYFARSGGIDDIINK